MFVAYWFYKFPCIVFLWFGSWAKRAGSSFLTSRVELNLLARLYNEPSQTSSLTSQAKPSCNELSWLDIQSYEQRHTKVFSNSKSKMSGKRGCLWLLIVENCPPSHARHAKALKKFREEEFFIYSKNWHVLMIFDFINQQFSINHKTVL